MATIGVQYRENPYGGGVSSLGDTLAKALTGDPDFEIKLAKAQSDMMVDAAQRKQLLQNTELLRQKTLQEQEALQSQTAGYGPAAEVYRSNLGPRPVAVPHEAQGPVRPGVDQPMPIIVNPQDVDRQNRWDVSYRNAPAIVRYQMGGGGNADQRATGYNTMQGGVLLQRTDDPSLQRAGAALTGHLPDRNTLFGPNDVSGVNADIAIENAKPHYEKGADGRMYQVQTQAQPVTSLSGAGAAPAIVSPVGTAVAGMPGTAPLGDTEGGLATQQLVNLRAKKARGEPLTVDEAQLLATLETRERKDTYIEPKVIDNVPYSPTSEGGLTPTPGFVAPKKPVFAGTGDEAQSRNIIIAASDPTQVITPEFALAYQHAYDVLYGPKAVPRSTPGGGTTIGYTRTPPPAGTLTPAQVHAIIGQRGVAPENYKPPGPLIPTQGVGPQGAADAAGPARAAAIAQATDLARDPYADLPGVDEPGRAPQLTDAARDEVRYTSRMAPASSRLDDYSPGLLSDTELWAAQPWDNATAGALANRQLSTNAQLMMGWGINFVSAVMRMESGAAIARPEFRQFWSQYIPEAGDTPERIAQKAMARQEAMRGILDGFMPGDPARDVVERRLKQEGYDFSQNPTNGGGPRLDKSQRRATGTQEDPIDFNTYDGR